MHVGTKDQTRGAPDIIGALRAGAGDSALALEMVSWRGGAEITRSWSRSDLLAAVARAGAAIGRRTQASDRVVVALPPGPPFAIACLACLATGRTAA